MWAWTLEELIGVVAVVAFMLGVACVVGFSRLPRALKLLIYAALALRIVGSWLRHAILFGFYGGIGDAGGYYARGLEVADRLWRLDFSPFVDSGLWLEGKWWGTQFVSFPSGIALSVIGRSFRGEFLAFALMGFLGLVGFAVAFRRIHPGIPLTRYARWIWLFPSLWFWPSSVGKEAIVLMGLGLAVAGYFGRNGRINWPLLIVGTFLVFGIRPQVAAVVILSFVLAHWLSLGSRWTTKKSLQGLAILGFGLAGIWLSMERMGVASFDIEGIHSYMEGQAASAADKGSALENVEVGLGGVPMALVNILARPFIWEAGNSMALLSALEILAFWVIVCLRGRNLMNALRTWRSDRFLRLAVPFILMYAITLGMLVVNLGIIARQRIFLFPFLFLLLEAAPARESKRSRVRRPAPLPRHGAGQPQLVRRGTT